VIRKRLKIEHYQLKLQIEKANDVAVGSVLYQFAIFN